MSEHTDQDLPGARLERAGLTDESEI